MNTPLTATVGYQKIQQWLAQKGYQPFAFQEETWEQMLQNGSGLVNAPTGCGKTFSVFLGAVIHFINQHPTTYQQQSKNGLQLLWITPLRALAKDVARAMQEALQELGIPWQVGVRNGDTTLADRQKQKKLAPEVWIVTPESLHLLFTPKNHADIFKTLQNIAVDEWHELLGGKRGVQVELGIAHILHIQKRPIRVWGISATIGNLQEALHVLTHSLVLQFPQCTTSIIKAQVSKEYAVHSIVPDEVEQYPWSGHLGLKLAHKVVPIIEQNGTTLLFINTRGMSEIWYQTLLQIAPQLAGAIALHHGSIEQELRVWVEEALHTQKLKAVVCTASLDLGVDFRPVNTIIQVGSPKGVARFLQRAGRSGHQPGEVSTVYFLPTHSLELLEAAALKKAIDVGTIESKPPMVLCFDVLIQFLCTLAIGGGFQQQQAYQMLTTTHCFAEMIETEWLQILANLTSGGKALEAYDDYKKVLHENGFYWIQSRAIAMRHRMHIGTIVSDAMMKVKLMSGKFIGVIEEYFVSKLNTGDVFTLAGRNVELLLIKEMTAIVKPSTSKKAIVPSWVGGRMPLSANLGELLRNTLHQVGLPIQQQCQEVQTLAPIFSLQQQLSIVPKPNQLLIEHIQSKDGYHVFCYPFEGRLVHEALAAILTYRLSQIQPITISYVMNDYGFELLSDQPIPINAENVYQLFSLTHITEHIQCSVNSSEMAKRKFRDIAVIGGLIFQGFPGEQKKARHLQSSASLLFKVFNEYDAQNILLRQAYQEVMDQQLEETRLRAMLTRIQNSEIIIMHPKKFTPFSFPIKVDELRESMSSEKLEDRIAKMQAQLLAW